MPKAINYKANSVVYFSGDFDERVFLLNTGSIALTSIDIETGEQVTDYIKTGEFFGVKSALGNYPREESAMVLTDSIVYSFTSKEFEAFAQTNTRIILQMIKVFSRQLRSIHKQLASLLDSEEETNPEEGLFNVMNAFYSSQHYKAAGQVGARYKAIYPSGKYISQVDQIVRSTAEVAGRSFGTAEGHNNDASFVQPEKPAPIADGTVYLTYNKAEDLFEKGEFEAAYDQYHAVIEAGTGDEITDKAYIGAGKTLHAQKEYVRCLQLLTGFISQHPKSLKIGDALMYLGMCYMDMERPDKAIAFFDKAALLSGADIIGKIRELQKNAALGCKESKLCRIFFLHFQDLQNFPKGSLIFAEFEPGSSFYLIQSGRVQLIKIINGFEKNLDILQPGEIFGEMAILDNSPRSASAIAYDDVMALEFNKENFEILMKGNPAIAMRLLKTFVRRIYAQRRRFMILTIEDRPARIADVFLMLDETQPNLDRTTEMRSFDTTIEEVARWAGLSKEETEDNMRKLIDQGRISVYDDRIIVQNMTDLTRYVNTRRSKEQNLYVL